MVILGLASKDSANHPAEEAIGIASLGTGSPIISTSRSKPAQAVIVEDKIFLVDCGAGTVPQLVKLGIEPRNVSGVFFTHFHSDHNAGFPDFYLSSWIGGTQDRSTPIDVYGPPTTKDTITKLIDAFSYDINVRIEQAHHSTVGLKVNHVEMAEGVIYNYGQLK